MRHRRLLEVGAQGYIVRKFIEKKYQKKNQIFQKKYLTYPPPIYVIITHQIF